MTGRDEIDHEGVGIDRLSFFTEVMSRLGAAVPADKALRVAEERWGALCLCFPEDPEDDAPVSGDDDTAVLPSDIGMIAGESALGDLIEMEGLDFDAPTAEDIYVAAVALANELLEVEDPSSAWGRKIERATLWLARVAKAHEKARGS